MEQLYEIMLLFETIILGSGIRNIILSIIGISFIVVILSFARDILHNWFIRRKYSWEKIEKNKNFQVGRFEKNIDGRVYVLNKKNKNYHHITNPYTLRELGLKVGDNIPLESLKECNLRKSIKIINLSLANEYVVFKMTLSIFLLTTFIFLYFLLIKGSKHFLFLLDAMIWPIVVLIAAFFFKKVFTYLFFSLERFNFFGTKTRKLKNVEEMIREKAKELRKAEGRKEQFDEMAKKAGTSEAILALARKLHEEKSKLAEDNKSLREQVRLGDEVIEIYEKVQGNTEQFMENLKKKSTRLPSQKTKED